MQKAPLAVAVCVLAACFGATLVRQHHPAAEAPQGPELREIDQKHVLPLAPVKAPAGTGDRALAHVAKLVGFGARNPGTPGWSLQLEYLCAELQKHGLVAARDTWTDRKELITFTNLRVTLPGKRKDRIVLAAHHDTKCTKGHPDPEHNFDFVGANDGGSGVAVLLELAPLLAAAPREATVELLFLDGEESLDWKWNGAARALFGSKRFVKQHRDALLLDSKQEPRIAALVLLDMVGSTDLHLQQELCSTPELRTIQWSAAVALGLQAQVFRRAEAASDDHTPFLEVGIPSVDLIDLNGNPHWHTANDTLENLSAASLQKTADLVLTMLPAIERTYVTGKD